MSNRIINFKTDTLWKKLIQFGEIIGLIVTPILSIHTLVYFVATKKNLEFANKMKGVLGFPGLILLSSFVICNPVLSISAAFCSIDTIKTKLTCIGLLIALPLPMFLFSVYVIHEYIESGFVTYEPIKYTNVVNKVKYNIYGRWSNTFVTHKYSIFFEHIKGFSDNKNKIINYFRIYHVPIKIAKNIIVPYITILITDEMYYSLSITLISFIYTLILFIVQPLNGFRQQVCESFGEIVTFFSHGTNFIMILNSSSANKFNELSLINKNVNLGLLIFSQSWSVLFIVIHLLYAHIKKYTKDIHNSKQDTVNNVKTEVVENSNDIDLEIFS